MWLAGGLTLGLTRAIRAPYVVGDLLASFVLGALGGLVVGAFVVASVRCPACGHRLLWAHFDDDTGLEPDPLNETMCPRCRVGAEQGDGPQPDGPPGGARR